MTVKRRVVEIPENLGYGKLYDEATGKYCVLGWNHTRLKKRGSPYASRLESSVRRATGLFLWAWNDELYLDEGDVQKTSAHFRLEENRELRIMGLCLALYAAGFEPRVVEG